MSVVSAALCREKASWWTGRRKLCLLALVGAAVVVGLLAWRFAENFRAVVPGRVYRSAQLSGAALHSRINECRLRSVLNLRGANPGEDWYDEECEATAEDGVRHYDLAADSEFPPSPGELRELITVLDRCERPMLIHCQSGIDRTGVVAAVCALLADDGSPELAHDQLGLLNGQLPWRAVAGRHQAFLRLYEQWLAAGGRQHTPSDFREWAFHHYVPRTELAQSEPGR